MSSKAEQVSRLRGPMRKSLFILAAPFSIHFTIGWVRVGPALVFTAAGPIARIGVCHIRTWL